MYILKDGYYPEKKEITEYEYNKLPSYLRAKYERKSYTSSDFVEDIATAVILSSFTSNDDSPSYFSQSDSSTFDGYDGGDFGGGGASDSFD